MKDTKQICRTEKFYMLLRLALGQTQDFSVELSDDDWMWMYDEAERQTLVGILYNGVKLLPEDKKPPFDVLMQWAYDADNIRRLNEKLNSEAARLTRLFAEQGCKTAILKGQANARLYPDKFCRQPGDIDIWVEGGLEKVSNLLLKMGLVEEAEAHVHHIEGVGNGGIPVEYHFLPSAGNRKPIASKRMLRWLEEEVLNAQMTELDFRVPTLRFELVAQLSHLLKHFVGSGVGLRHVCDYYILLQKSTVEDRELVSSLLSRFGLCNIADALMWLLSEKFCIEKDIMLCKPDEYRGRWLERKILEEGNFGCYAEKKEYGKWRQIFYEDRLKRLKLMCFDFWGPFKAEMDFWQFIFRSIPDRIRYRTLSLSSVKDKNS